MVSRIWRPKSGYQELQNAYGSLVACACSGRLCYAMFCQFTKRINPEEDVFRRSDITSLFPISAWAFDNATKWFRILFKILAPSHLYVQQQAYLPLSPFQRIVLPVFVNSPCTLSSHPHPYALLMRLNPVDVFPLRFRSSWYPKSLSTNARKSSSRIKIMSSHTRVIHRWSMILTSRSSSSSVGAEFGEGNEERLVCGLFCTMAS